MPDQSSDTTLSQWVAKNLTGWEEIRQALVFVDSLTEEERNGALVKVNEHSQESSVKVSWLGKISNNRLTPQQLV